MGKQGEAELVLRMDRPVRYRWSGKFVAMDENWIHMERQLVDYELIVMEKGSLFIQDEWGKYEVREGEYLLMGPTVLQRGWKASKCRFYWMHFWPGEECIEERDGGKPVISGREDREQISEGLIRLRKHGQLQNAERIFNLMKQLQDSDLRYMDTEMNSYLASGVLFELKNQVCMEQRMEPKDDLKSQVDEYILSHISDSFTMADIAKHFGYHEKYFATLFKKATGCSVKQYVDTRKVERAKYLLLNTDAWVLEIAEHLGYQDVQNFYHVFKKATNCSPSQYRSIYNKKLESHL